jgi:hypothetical protein
MLRHSMVAVPAGLCLLLAPACSDKEICTLTTEALSLIVGHYNEDLEVLLKLVQPQVEGKCEQTIRRLKLNPASTVSFKLRIAGGSTRTVSTSGLGLTARPTSPSPGSLSNVDVVRVFECKQSYPNSQFLYGMCYDRLIEP